MAITEGIACALFQTYDNVYVSGYVPEKLAKKTLGVMHHARWLTLASRILRYYVSNPVVRAEGVETLARYVVQVYYKVRE